jgi:hypothetical protein
MAQLPREEVPFKDFLGLATNVDDNDLSPGAAREQVNACCIRQAELGCRQGVREVTFEE